MGSVTLASQSCAHSDVGHIWWRPGGIGAGRLALVRRRRAVRSPPKRPLQCPAKRQHKLVQGARPADAAIPPALTTIAMAPSLHRRHPLAFRKLHSGRVPHRYHEAAAAVGQCVPLMPDIWQTMIPQAPTTAATGATVPRTGFLSQVGIAIDVELRLTWLVPTPLVALSQRWLHHLNTSLTITMPIVCDDTASDNPLMSCPNQSAANHQLQHVVDQCTNCRCTVAYETTLHKLMERKLRDTKR